MSNILEWMRRPASSDEATKARIARLEAIREIEQTRGFQMIVEVFEKQHQWAERELTRDLDWDTTDRLRQYLKALDVLRIFLKSTDINGKEALKAAQQTGFSIKEMDLDAYHALVFQKQ